jgi:hypothetical protein
MLASFPLYLIFFFFHQVIAIDQDPLAQQGVRIAVYNSSKELKPTTSGTCQWNVTHNGYNETCDGAAGNLFCFTNTTLEQAIDFCCNSSQCAG